MDDIGPDGTRERIDAVAELLEEGGREVEPAQGLLDYRGRDEQALDERPAEAEGRPKRVAQARRVEARGDLGDQVRAPGDIAAGGCERTAQVLYERAHHEIRAGVGRLGGFDQFAVAVVDQHRSARRARSHPFDDRADLRDRERRTRRVAARALHEDRPDVAGRQFARDAVEIRRAVVEQRDLAIADALRLGERVLGVADRVAQRVVWLAASREQRSAVARAGGQRRDDRVRAADDREPRERPFAAEHPCEQSFVGGPGGVVVTVAGRSGEIALRDARFEKRVQHVSLHPRLRVVAQIAHALPRAQRRIAHGALNVESATQ